MKKHQFTIFVLALMLTAIIGDGQTCPGSAGCLDPAFDGDGKVVTHVSDFNDTLNAAAAQPDGKIVVAGYVSYGATNTADFVVARYNTNGSPDTTFDGDGIAIVDIDLFDTAYSLAIQPDGKIVVAGNGVNFTTSFRGLAIVRLNADGSLDTTFDGDGKATAPYGNFGIIRSVALQADGKIVLAGDLSDGTDSNSLFYRYNPDGSPDTSFDGDGKLVVELSAFDDTITTVIVQPDGKIVGGAFGIMMRQPNVFEDDFMVVRLNPDGSLDTTFDSDGRLNTPIGPNMDRAISMALQPDGKIVQAGFTQDAAFNIDFAVVRYNADGSPDTSFDGDGKIITPVGSGNDFGQSVKIQTDGKIVVGGFASNGSNNDFAVVRYNPDGSLDTTFDGDGKVLTAVGSESDEARTMTLQPDGKIVLAGYSRIGTNDDFSLARYLAGSTAPRRTPFDFDGDGRTDLSIYRPPVGEWWYLRSSDGGNAAAQFGGSSDKITPGDFTGDGKTDIAFWREQTGEWFILRSEDGSFFSFPFGSSGDIPVPSDFDGDGKTDAAVFRPSTGTWYILNSGGSGTAILNFGIAEDKPVPADFDGDGRADIAIFRPSDGSWWYLRSSDLQFRVYRFGVGTDKPVQGDFTGDGKADIAVWRPQTGEWFVQRSEDDSYFSFPFGQSGDVPAPGDYDGDGKWDAGIFRGGTWYVQRSTSGILIQQFGLPDDKPVPSAFVP